MMNLSKATLSMIAVRLVVVALGAGFVGVKLGRRSEYNEPCCHIPSRRNIVVSAQEMLGLASFHSQFDQDKW